jgi:hypothetical protein
MNYYNPYFMSYPYANVSNMARGGLFNRLFGGINMSSILSGTQKTLNIVNQTIPLVKQAQPILKNAKTMFKVMNEFKKVDTPSEKSTSIEQKIEKKEVPNQELVSNGPTFFI